MKERRSRRDAILIAASIGACWRRLRLRAPLPAENGAPASASLRRLAIIRRYQPLQHERHSPSLRHRHAAASAPTPSITRASAFTVPLSRAADSCLMSLSIRHHARLQPSFMSWASATLTLIIRDRPQARREGTGILERSLYRTVAIIAHGTT